MAIHPFNVEVAVVGAGKMGALLAQAYAQNGHSVALVARRSESLKRALGIIDREMGAAVENKIFPLELARETRERIFATTDFSRVCRGKNLQLLLETATEDMNIKKEIFRLADELTEPSVLLATNTSCLDANLVSSAAKRRERMVWMHFFFPPHKNRAAELAGLEGTSEEFLNKANAFLSAARRKAVTLLRYRKGGAANVVFMALLLEAVRLREEGLDVPSIEAAAREAFGQPAGFLSLMDRVGLQIASACIKAFTERAVPDDPVRKVYDNFFHPPALLLRAMEEEQKGREWLWISERDDDLTPADPMVLDLLKRRFLGVAFMTAGEVVESGLVEISGIDDLCREAFGWKEGPFSLMNRHGVGESLRMVTERMEISHRKEINFPVPSLLITQAKEKKPWPL